MKASLLLIAVMLLSKACASQINIKPCADTIEVDIEISGFFDQKLLVKDSMIQQIQIIFERSFNDSVYIFCDQQLQNIKRIKTNETMGVNPEIVTIDYLKLKKIPKISVVLKNENKCISFYPIKGKQIAYINHINNGWSVELSNIMREYR